MAKFNIWNIDAREDLGTYVAETEDAALDAMAQAYGFASYEACMSEYGTDAATASQELRITRED